MKFIKQSWVGLAIACLIPLTGCTSTNEVENESSSTTNNNQLEAIKTKGTLNCGVNGQLPGFSYIDEQSRYSGMDADFCRAVAAALFDDPEAVKFRDLSAQERFPAIQSGEVDLLSRNTTWTISRDTSVGMEFAPTLFYDGQGMIVSAASGVRSLEGLAGKSICVQSGTTTELNLADQMRQRGIDYTPVVFDDADAMYAAYEQARCEGATSDRSQLIVRRAVMADPESHILLEEVLSKEPLAPAVASGDAAWFDAVKWTAFALIQAEEFGINSENLDEFLASEDPSIRRFLGVEGNLGEEMGLPNDFAARIIRHVGNYAEVYDRNLGEPFALERGLNALWTDGGLLYSPPFR